MFAKAEPKPTLTGFLATLTPMQKKRALAYKGPENHGDPAFKKPFDRAAYQREYMKDYMREYMRKKRAKDKATP